jgi:hypothetical protein
VASRWTIDTLHAALPHPEAQRTFLRDVNRAPVDELPAVLGRWVGAVEEQEADRGRLEGLRAHYLAHGELPSEVEAGCVDITCELLRWLDQAPLGAQPVPGARGAA